MRLRLLIPLLALLAALVALPASASAKKQPNYRVGIGDQYPQLFANADYQALHVKRVRYLVPWDFQREAFQKPEIQAYLDAAKASHDEVLVAFTASRGCYRNGHYSKKKHCRAPSNKKYGKSIKAFRKAFPQIKHFQPWNEINHVSQPTYKSPKRAAGYYKTLRRYCKRHCTIVAADILDSSNAIRYVKKFQRYTRHQHPKLWGLHNYSDTNRYRSRITTKFLRAVPGKVWLTETGGLVKFLPHFKYSTSRANKATKYMFKLADRYSKKRHGMRSRIDRLYPYSFFGQVNSKKTRFDSGLVGPVDNAKHRKAYRSFKKVVKHRRK